MTTYNPGEVIVDVVGGKGCYVARKNAEGSSEPIYVPSPAGEDSLHEWVMNLDDSQLEAARQMYWDKWNFQSDDESVRTIMETLDVERSRRQLPHSTFAPGIFK
jgi:hypothetical protein